jgi:hypothetical protein
MEDTPESDAVRSDCRGISNPGLRRGGVEPIMSLMDTQDATTRAMADVRLGEHVRSQQVRPLPSALSQARRGDHNPAAAAPSTANPAPGHEPARGDRRAAKEKDDGRVL